METGRNDRGDTFVLSFLCGLVTGAALAVLFAPARGRDTRERLAAAAREGFDQASKAVERGEQALDTIREEAADVLADGKAAYRGARAKARAQTQE
jgi:gas vesicle protein